MKIVKLCVIDDIHYVVFDEIPEITYEEDGSLMIGSYEDSEGIIILSNYFRYSSLGKAFGENEVNERSKRNIRTSSGNNIRTSVLNPKIITKSEKYLLLDIINFGLGV